VRRAELEAVQAVLPAYDNAPDRSAVRVPRGEGDSLQYYVGLRDGAPSGVAFRTVSREGYGGEIELMVGVDPAGRVTGVRLLRHAETPGLGARYAEPELLERFYAGRGLDDTDWSVRPDGGDVDAITGATVTGRAVARALRSGLEGFAADRERVLPDAGPAPAPEPDAGSATQAEGGRS
jgi:electron transport complex protein RnfG